MAADVSEEKQNFRGPFCVTGFGGTRFHEESRVGSVYSPRKSREIPSGNLISEVEDVLYGVCLGGRGGRVQGSG